MLHKIKFFTTSLITFFTVVQVGIAQSDSYILLNDPSGMAPSTIEVAELEKAADSLVAAFPVEYRDSFKVIEGAIYPMMAYTGGGLENSWSKLKTKAADTSAYYLLLVKDYDQSGKVKWRADLKLPTSGVFDCIDDMSSNIDEDIVRNIQSTINSSPSSITQVDGIAQLRFILKDKIRCCTDDNFRGGGTECSNCVLTPGSIVDAFIEKDILIDYLKITDDPDYNEPPIAFGEITNRSTSILNCRVSESGLISVPIDSIINSFINEQSLFLSEEFSINTSASLHVFKYPRDCANFNTIWENYLADNSALKFFFGLVNYDGELGFIGFHVSSTISAGFNKEEINVRTNNEYFRDELEALREAEASAGNSCKELVKACFSQMGHSIALTQSQGYYTARQRAIILGDLEKAALKTQKAAQEFMACYQKEYEIVKRKYDNWRECVFLCTARARWETTTNLCQETIHTLLGMCGLIPAVGSVCDVTNAVVYLTSGDLSNAALSVASAVPIAEYGVFGVKYGGRLWKATGLAGGCLSQGAVAGTNYCRMLSFTVKATGEINWVGGRDKLRNLMSTYINLAGKQAHHLVPWELNQHPVVKIMAAKGWHMSNPVQNGKTISDAIHMGSHGKYNSLVLNILNELQIHKITSTTPPSQAIQTMNKLRNELSGYIDKAVNSGQSMNQYFDKINWRDIYNKL